MLNKFKKWLHISSFSKKEFYNQINQLKVKGTNNTLGDLGGIESVKNIAIDKDLSKFGLFNSSSIFDGAFAEIEINQENANGIRAIISADSCGIASALKEEGLLGKIESLIDPQKQINAENTIKHRMKIRDEQNKSSITKLPNGVCQHLFSYLDTRSLSQFNKTCTLFYNESRDMLDYRHKLMLNDRLSNFEKKLTQVENDLDSVNGKITYNMMGYFFEARSNGNGNVANIDFKLRQLVPAMREYILSILYNAKLLERQGIKMDEEFSRKLKDVRIRFDKKCGGLAKFDLEKVESSVQEEIQMESKIFTKRV